MSCLVSRMSSTSVHWANVLVRRACRRLLCAASLSIHRSLLRCLMVLLRSHLPLGRFDISMHLTRSRARCPVSPADIHLPTVPLGLPLDSRCIDVGNRIALTLRAPVDTHVLGGAVPDWWHNTGTQQHCAPCAPNRAANTTTVAAHHSPSASALGKGRASVCS